MSFAAKPGRLVLVLAVVVLQACAPRSEAGGAGAPIVRGVDDVPEIYPAVVRVMSVPPFGDASTGTGTLIAADDTGRGWVLTAAHVVMPVSIIPDLAPVEELRVFVGVEGDSTEALTVVGVHVHPDYGFDRRLVDGVAFASSGPSADVALLEVTGVPPTLVASAIPLLDAGADGLGPGAELVAVGYGITSSSAGLAPRRQRAAVVLSQIVSTRRGYEQLVLDQSTGGSGTCQGDSGGPLLEVSGSPRVAGIVSAVLFESRATICDGRSIHGRASQVEPWVTSVMEGERPAPSACLACTGHAAATGGACHDVLVANAAGIRDFRTCLQGGGEATCRAASPGGAAAFDAYWSCVKGACPSCNDGEHAIYMCGYAMDGGAECDECMRTSCCGELAACRGDATCSPCLARIDADATTCREDPTYATARACLAASCSAQCGEYLAILREPGPVERDAGPSDAGVTVAADAGSELDAAAAADAAAVADAGIAAPAGGCVVARAPAPLPLAGLLLALALAWSRRRPAGAR